MSEKAIVDNNLPVSIKVIAWVYMVLGVLIAVLPLWLVVPAILTLLGFGHFYSTFWLLLFILCFAILIGIMYFFVGKFLLKKNKRAWKFALVLAVLSVLQSYTVMTNTINNSVTTQVGFPLFALFVIWKLWEYRKLFGIGVQK